MQEPNQTQSQEEAARARHLGRVQVIAETIEGRGAVLQGTAMGMGVSTMRNMRAPGGGAEHRGYKRRRAHDPWSILMEDIFLEVYGLCT
jgi:hypothetical protein